MTSSTVIAHGFDHSVVHHTAHRPWPMPSRRWVMTQTWHDLLFAHWPIEATALRNSVPPEFDLDLFDGVGWIGVVPFRMSNVAPRGVPSLPWISAFPELNVRTYVRVGNRPGVFFFSLDAGRTLAVKVARAILNLPYHTAQMSVSTVGREVQYRSARASDPAVEFVAAYEPVGPSFNAMAGTFEYFLTERYCLYHRDRRGAPYRLDIHHPPWDLRPAHARIERNTMAAANGLRIAGPSPMLHFALRQDVIAWMPVDLSS